MNNSRKNKINIKNQDEKNIYINILIDWNNFFYFFLSKLGCRYERGTWSECDVKLQLQKRVDHIKERFKGPECTDTRVITKKCETNDKKGRYAWYLKNLNQILFEMCKSIKDLGTQ